MKVNRGYITVTDLPAGARIEQLEGGNVLFDGLDGISMTADEAREIRDALNIVLGERAGGAPGLIVDSTGDNWWKLSNGTYLCRNRQPSAEEAQRYADVGEGSTREYIQESYGIRFEK